MDPGVFAGIYLGQQQFEYRLVGRLDALEQLPEPGADKFAGRDKGQVAEVEGFIGADKALGNQGMGVAVVARFFVDRHQPPDRRAPGQPDRGAVKLVQQQVVLGGAAIFRAQLGIALTADETARVDQEKMRFGALAGGPGFQQLAFLAQLGEFVFGQVRPMADPHIHVALVGLGQGAEAAHQEQSVNRPRRVAAVARLVGKRAGQALGFSEDIGIRLEIRQPGRRTAGNVTGQQRMVNVEKQRQQGQDPLLAGRQPFHGASHASFVEFQKTCAQLAENLAVDSLVQIGADFMGARHVSSNRLAGLGRGALRMRGSLAP
ncbi:hypothetical protein D9M71_369780 [compost metagenome]